MPEYCKPTNVPQVDNSALECEQGFYKAKCIIHTDAISYLGLPENSSMDVVIQALLNSLIDARNRIIQLENQ